MKKPLFRMLWCESVAPLGKPVVPEVYWMLIGSSNCSDALALGQLARSRRASPRRAAPPSRRPARAPRAARAAVAHLGEHADVVGRAERPRQHQQARRPTAAARTQLGGLVGRIDVDQDRADPRGRVLDDHPLVAVGRPDADAVALADAVRQQPARGARGLRPTAAGRSRGSPGGGPPAPRGRRTLDGPAQVLADGLAEQRHRRSRHGRTTARSRSRSSYFTCNPRGRAWWRGHIGRDFQDFGGGSPPARVMRTTSLWAVTASSSW